MRALTLYRPWSWAVCHAGKRIENRPWAPWLSIMGHDLAVHAGKTYDRDGRAFIVGRGFTPPSNRECPEGIVAVARVVGHYTHSDGRVLRNVGTPPMPDGQLQWFGGPYGWLLDHVRVLARPVPCRGSQGLWRLPDETEAEVVRQLAELGAGGAP